MRYSLSAVRSDRDLAELLTLTPLPQVSSVICFRRREYSGSGTGADRAPVTESFIAEGYRSAGIAPTRRSS
jgi:hypothetical protein